MKVDADAAGLDAGRLARVEEHLRARYLQPGKIAGCQVAVVRHGALGYFASLGHRDRERSGPVTEDTIWRLYSMTKPITGVALMTLYERGHFQLDDPVDRWIPEWKGMQVRHVDADGTERLVPAHRPPSVRDVLMHMSGIGYGPDNRDLDLAERAWRSGLTLETLTRQIGGWPLRYQPGTQWLYSFGMDVCARLVEVLSGRAFDDYLAAEIFEPLGMVDTGFVVADDDLDRFAACYGRNARKELVLVDDPETSSYRRPPSLLDGGGGLVGTTPDYLRFVRMLANGGELDGRRILSRKTVELMTTNHLPGGGELADFALPGAYGEVGFAGAGFGLTMAVAKGPVATGVVGSAGEFMWGGAASTTFFVDPVEDLALVFMTQLLPSGTFNFRGQLKAIVYGAIAD
jgi:CubicO group peptidase (beta-lactamase class C family)